MKTKKTGSQRRRINFAVDRDEIEINSDWVEAVMASPVRQLPEETPAVPAEARADRFFVPPTKTATGEESAPGAECSSVEKNAAVVESNPVARSTSVEQNIPVDSDATVAALEGAHGKVFDEEATVENNATVAQAQAGRVWRPRPIHRVTDGLTPGQYSVYRLMYEAGQGTGDEPRTYTGGYADLRRLTGLSKRGIQNIIAELQVKQVIFISQKPGYHRSETTSYVVPDTDSVLKAWFANGWRYALGKSKLLNPPRL